MTQRNPTPRDGQSSLRCHGVVSGYLFKMVRESIGVTQVELAERLGVDSTTVQGWESGRRSLTAVRANDLARLRMKLIRLGAPPSVFPVLGDAIEADLVIADAVEVGDRAVDPDHHLLAASVHRRDLTNLITWPFTGLLPPRLANLPQQRRARRGPVPDRPTLSVAERTRFFDHLLVNADAHRRDPDTLLRRQAIYLLGFDQRAGSADWLVAEHRRTVGEISRTDHVSSWVAARSSSVALARNGNKEALRAFVSTGLINDTQEIANLNYWAYWVGEIVTPHADDSFMIKTQTDEWGGARLLTHLINRLNTSPDYTDLTVHTLWALVAARPSVLSQNTSTRTAALANIERAIADADLAPQARQELTSVAYAIRLSNR